MVLPTERFDFPQLLSIRYPLPRRILLRFVELPRCVHNLLKTLDILL